MFIGGAPDTATLVDSVLAAQGHIRAAGSTAEIRNAAADKGGGLYVWTHVATY